MKEDIILNCTLETYNPEPFENVFPLLWNNGYFQLFYREVEGI